MKKKLEGKFLPMDYIPIKDGELKHKFDTSNFDDKPTFDEYLDEESTFNAWYESGFDDELNKEVVKELGEYPTFDDYYERVLEENLSEGNAKESDKEQLFDVCYDSEFEDEELEFVELLWSPKKLNKF